MVDLEVEVPVKVLDEIGLIARSFNSMVVSLRGLTHNLEEKVKERTIELHAAIEKMESINFNPCRIAETSQKWI